MIPERLPDPIFFSQCIEQRLRFRYLRKFRRRREAFERGGEHGVGIGGAAGRLVELRQLRAPLAGRSYARPAAVRRRWRRGMLPRRAPCLSDPLEQDVAANAVEEGVGPAFARLDSERERCVDPARGAFRVLSFGFELGEQTLEDRDPLFVSLLGICSDRLSKLRRAHRTLAKPSVRPTGRELTQS